MLSPFAAMFCDVLLLRVIAALSLANHVLACCAFSMPYLFNYVLSNRFFTNTHSLIYTYIYIHAHTGTNQLHRRSYLRSPLSIFFCFYLLGLRNISHKMYFTFFAQFLEKRLVSCSNLFAVKAHHPIIIIVVLAFLPLVASHLLLSSIISHATHTYTQY